MERTRNQRRGFGRILRGLGDLVNPLRSVDNPSRIRTLLGEIPSRKVDVVPEKQLLPLKHLRLRQLADAGFNTPDFEFWLRGQLLVPKLLEFHKKYVERNGISLRTFTEETILQETPKLPVKYCQRDWNIVLDFCGQHNQIHHTLVNESFPLEQSLITGK